MDSREQQFSPLVNAKLDVMYELLQLAFEKAGEILSVTSLSEADRRWMRGVQDEINGVMCELPGDDE